MKVLIRGIFLLLVVSSTIFAQPEAEELNNYFSLHFKNLKDTYGVVFLEDFRISSIGYKIGQRRTWDVEFSSSHAKVFFIGKCNDDEYCPDIDMAIYDETGKLITEDTDDDNFPSIALSNVPEGTYSIRITEYDCMGICMFCVGVYSIMVAPSE